MSSIGKELNCHFFPYNPDLGPVPLARSLVLGGQRVAYSTAPLKQSSIVICLPGSKSLLVRSEKWMTCGLIAQR